MCMSRAYLRDSGIDFKIRTIELDGKRIKLQIVSRTSSFFCASNIVLTVHASGILLVSIYPFNCHDSWHVWGFFTHF